MWGAMGGTAMIGLGLALAQPKRRVAVLTGDGDMLMGLGSLATIGVKQPNNLVIVVLDNVHYGETGMQPSHTSAGIDLVGTALACRFKHARAVSRMDEAAEVRTLLHQGDGPILISARIAEEDAPRVLPIRDGHLIKNRFIEALNAGSR
jgi:thiamine pyrophosphate-dependent acetolactate synthase large subunit-like protein